MWSVALAVTLAEKREKEVTNGALCAEVRKIVVKACPRLPNKKQLAAMGLDDDEAVVVLADSDAEDIFDVEEGVRTLPRSLSPRSDACVYGRFCSLRCCCSRRRMWRKWCRWLSRRSWPRASRRSPLSWTTTMRRKRRSTMTG